ncbi:uncharacterized protein LOC142181775 [Nicotiana tabacum]|uniref:Uncharacterized protein LOC142181775 n=1 Tax=Nicotiana tabacum TaxID=4097 RepID=A0AC58UQE9_TOBAC
MLNFLHCHVKERQGPLDCIVTVIYGFNAIEHREAMWQGLKQVALGVHVPWLIIGDFNAMLLPQYRIFGNPVTYAEIKAYSEYVTDLLLSELQWKDEYYIWSNKQGGADRVCSRLDRAFGNHEWMLQWGNVVIEYELPFIFDHSPMILSLKTKARNINVPFGFFNVWTSHQDILTMLNNIEFKSISQKIVLAREELQLTQEMTNAQCTDQLLGKEKQILLDLEKWSLVEESALR